MCLSINNQLQDFFFSPHPSVKELLVWCFVKERLNLGRRLEEPEGHNLKVYFGVKGGTKCIPVTSNIINYTFADLVE